MLSKDQIIDMQQQLGVKADGILGPNTIKALQAKLGVRADGIIGPATITAMKNAGATLWAAEFQGQASTVRKTARTAPKSAAAPKPQTFNVPAAPLTTVKFDMHKIGMVFLGIAAAGFLAFAVTSGKLPSRA